MLNRYLREQRELRAKKAVEAAVLRQKEKRQVLECLRCLHVNGHKLNSSIVLQNSKAVYAFLTGHVQPPLSGYKLHLLANTRFGSWSGALWAAGLNPNEIQLRSRGRKSHLPVILSQREHEWIAENRRRVTYLGTPPKTPDKILQEVESKLILESALFELEPQDQFLAEKIFDAILSIHHCKNRDDLIEHLSFFLDKKVGKEQIKSILDQLALKISSTQGDFYFLEQSSMSL